MNLEHEHVKKIYMGYHPRTHDGSVPQTRDRSESIAIMNAFNEQQGEDRFRAEVIGIACSELCAVVVMETKIDKVWQYL